MQIQKRTLIIEIIIAAFVLIAAGSLVYLIKTGKIKFSADSLTNLRPAIITVTGQSINPSTNKGVANVTVTLFAEGFTPVTALTNSTGHYIVQLTVPAEISLMPRRTATTTPTRPDLVYVQQEMAGYALSSESDEFALTVPTNTNRINLTQNFSTYPFIISDSSTKTKTPTRATTSGSTSSVVSVPNSSLPSYCNLNGYTEGSGDAINGIIFCATNDEDGYNLTAQTNIANQIQAMQTKTGKTGLVSEILIGHQTDIDKACNYVNAAGCANTKNNAIFLRDEDLGNDSFSVETRAHEFAHLVDWNSGFWTNTDAPGCYNYLAASNSNGNKYYCYGSSKKAFLSSFYILTTNGAVTDYAIENEKEFFAEAFAGYWQDISMSGSQLTAINPDEQYLLKYSARNWPFLRNDNTDKFPLGGFGGKDSVSFLNPYNHGKFQNQNALLYVDDIVSSSFSNNGIVRVLSDVMSVNDIAMGNFTSSTLIPISLVDQNNKPMGNVNVNIESTDVTTRAIASKRFPGADILGTAVVVSPNGPATNAAITLTGLPAGATYTPTTVNLTTGANPVVTIKVTVPSITSETESYSNVGELGITATFTGANITEVGFVYTNNAKASAPSAPSKAPADYTYAPFPSNVSGASSTAPITLTNKILSGAATNSNGGAVLMPSLPQPPYYVYGYEMNSSGKYYYGSQLGPIIGRQQ